MKDAFLYSATFGFVTGILIRSFVVTSLFVTILVGLIAFGLFLFSLTIAKDVSSSVRFSSKYVVTCISIALFCAGLGLFRTELAFVDQRDPMLKKTIGQKISVRGVVTEEPDVREENMRLTITLDGFLRGEQIVPIAKTKILVTTDLYPKHLYGDRLELLGILKEPGDIESDNGRTFDYAGYLGKDDIVYTMSRPQVKSIGLGEGNLVKARLLGVKSTFVEIIENQLPAPASSLLSGILIGGKRALGEDLQDLFVRAGIIHIVVLSGYNITIVGDFLRRILFFLPPAMRSLASIGAIILFAIMAGGTATVVRSAIMAGLAIFAGLIRRPYAVSRALLLAGVAMLIHNPKILVFDSSFQLSFMATAALIYGSPIVEQWLKKIPERFNIRALVASTIATQLFVLPMILYKIGTVSLVALPVNLLVLLTMPGLMGLGFVMALLGLFNYYLALPLAYACYLILEYILGVVKLFATIPFAAVAIPAFPLLGSIAIYGGYFFVWRFIVNRQKIARTHPIVPTISTR